MRSISGPVYSFAMSRIVARAFHFDCTTLYCTPRAGYSTRCGGRDVSCIYWLCGQDVDVCYYYVTVRNPL